MKERKNEDEGNQIGKQKEKKNERRRYSMSLMSHSSTVIRVPQ